MRELQFCAIDWSIPVKSEIPHRDRFKRKKTDLINIKIVLFANISREQVQADAATSRRKEESPRRGVDKYV